MIGLSDSRYYISVYLANYFNSSNPSIFYCSSLVMVFIIFNY